MPLDDERPERAAHVATALFPLLDGQAFEDLVADIRAHGLREPGWLDRAGETILDGRNRARACQAAGVEMRWRRYEGEPGTEVALIISLNLVRRHLTADQRAGLAADLATMRQGERTDLPPNGGTLQAETSTISQSDAAKLMQVPLRRVQRAARVKKSAPEMHAAIKAGTMKVSDATKKIAPSRRRRARRRVHIVKVLETMLGSCDVLAQCGDPRTIKFLKLIRPHIEREAHRWGSR